MCSDDCRKNLWDSREPPQWKWKQQVSSAGCIWFVLEFEYIQKLNLK